MSGHPLERTWWHPPDGFTQETGITQTMRRTLKRLAWTDGSARLSEMPHPGRVPPLAKMGLVRLEGDVVTLTEEGRAALAKITQFEENAS